MFDFYIDQGFKLFPCNIDKTPRVKSWRSTSSHIDASEADRVAETGGYIGAWLPPNYVIIDIDRNHRDRSGNPKADGLISWQALLRDLKLPDDLLKTTLVVKTGSGGMHLYFTLPDGTDYRTLSQKAIADSVDTRTHLGYVIAAGTNGYTVHNHAPVIEIPAELFKLIQVRTKDRAKEFRPTKQLSRELLRKVLKRIDATDFSTNDLWQEFVTACIAVAGNSDEVLDLIEEWSKTDSKYANDTTIRKRIETFEPDGGITVGTFLYILKKQQVSKYLVDKVRMEVGAQFSYSESFSSVFDPPFAVDYSKIHDNKVVMEAFYYTRHQSAGVNLFAALVRDELLYATQERGFYYFDGNRWVETPGILSVIFVVLLQAGQRFYTDVSREKDGDADEYINSYIGFIGSLSVIIKFEQALKQHPDLARRAVFWDSPDLQGTLTLADSVMDFREKGIVFRKGEKEEYRRLFIDLHEKDFVDQGSPEAFKSFLKDVFPDTETRKTATYALATMLSGTGKFRKFQIWNGAGSNGKSTLMEIMKHVIGERAISYKADVLLTKQHVQSLTPELAVFRGALVAFSSETEESKRVSQGAVKALTGNETMTANPKYQSMIEFKTTFQVVLSTNYLPNFSAHDAAFIKRVIILPFYTCFFHTEEEREMAANRGSRYFIEARDPIVVADAVKAERPKILFYLARRYQELGDEIPESAECRTAKNHYIDENNDIINFINEFVEYSDSDGWFTPTRELTDFYNEENSTRYSSKFVVMRVREVYPLVETHSKMINGKLTRGLHNIRLKLGAYPEGYDGNFTKEEKQSRGGMF